MGLLDDAIREHLELKRRRGADPGEIAHEERAALAAPHGEDEPHPGHEPHGGDALYDADALHPDDESRAGGEPHAGNQPYEGDEPREPGEEPHARGGHQAGGQSEGEGAYERGDPHGEETAELDMRSVLVGEDPQEHGPGDSGGAGEPFRPSFRQAEQADAGWGWESEPAGGTGGSENRGEEDGGPGTGIPEEIPGQERMSFE